MKINNIFVNSQLFKSSIETQFKDAEQKKSKNEIKLDEQLKKDFPGQIVFHYNINSAFRRFTNNFKATNYERKNDIIAKYYGYIHQMTGQIENTYYIIMDRTSSRKIYNDYLPMIQNYIRQGFKLIGLVKHIPIISSDNELWIEKCKYSKNYIPSKKYCNDFPSRTLSYCGDVRTMPTFTTINSICEKIPKDTKIVSLYQKSNDNKNNDELLDFNQQIKPIENIINILQNQSDNIYSRYAYNAFNLGIDMISMIENQTINTTSLILDQVISGQNHTYTLERNHKNLTNFFINEIASQQNCTNMNQQKQSLKYDNNDWNNGFVSGAAFAASIAVGAVIAVSFIISLCSKSRKYSNISQGDNLQRS